MGDVMKALLGGVALSILAAAPVMGTRPPKPRLRRPRWPSSTGRDFYIGATAGYGHGHPHHHDLGAADQNSTTFTMAGFVAGGTVGYNLQFNQIVLGSRSTFPGRDIHGTGSTVAGLFNCAGACRIEVESFATHGAGLIGPSPHIALRHGRRF
jgi:hypothetical protein